MTEIHHFLQSRKDHFVNFQAQVLGKQNQISNGLTSLNSKYASLHQSDDELKGKMVNIMNKKLIL